MIALGNVPQAHQTYKIPNVYNHEVRSFPHIQATQLDCQQVRNRFNILEHIAFRIYIYVS